MADQIWRKTSASQGSAVPGHAAWRKSSYSHANGNCVEVAVLPDGQVTVRDSKDPDGPVLRFTPAEFTAFVAGMKRGEFDHLAMRPSFSPPAEAVRRVVSGSSCIQ
jgi:hypothetical protein